MNKKLSFLYCTFVPCKSFVLDFFIVEKTFAFYEKILFSEEKTSAIFCFIIFEGRNFRKNVQKSRKLRKFLPLKYIELPSKEDDTIFKQKLDFLIKPVSKYLEWIKELAKTGQDQFIYLLLIFLMSIRFLVIHY